VTNEREDENVFDFVGETDRHTHTSLAENRQRMLPRTATAMSLTAFQGDHDQYEELATAA
jgi:ABC-type transporter Mla MlaB component